jgi:hypothetical protein
MEMRHDVGTVKVDIPCIDKLFGWWYDNLEKLMNIFRGNV